MSDEATPDISWEDIAESWRLDELLAGRMQPTTSDDVRTLMTIRALRDQWPPNEPARLKAFDAMMAAAEGGAGTDKNQTPRDPARIEQTRQAMLSAFQKPQQHRED
ncbi:hypothetical protein ABZW47_31110 [Streptomyces sp. NPDC004549]|uniref:hypothetical protein n=1 Tax=Streptomyces sp. NPDC004549 TaxID=3154283 RepID=UPI0033AAACE7